MALNIQVGHVTQPGATGNQDTTLPADFDPKALILIAVPAAADGVVAHSSFCLGFATYRGAAVQQVYTSVFAEDNVATSDTYDSMSNDGVVKLSDGAGAIDLEIDFVSFTTGAGSKFTLNWVNLHTTASVRVFYMVLGGSDLQDAQAHNFTLTTGAGALDVALGSGFGHPNVVFFSRIANDITGSFVNQGNVGIGFGILAGDNRSIWYGSADNAATEASFQRVDSDSALVAGAGGSIETDFVLAAEGGFPTDGYEITKSTVSFAETTIGLALKLSSNVTVTAGQGTARTSTGDTDLAVGTSTPKGLVLLHTRQTAADSTDSTSADAAHLGIGFVDGAGNERWAGTWDDDAQAAASVASSAQVNGKALQIYTPSTDVLDGEADGSVVGSNFRLTTGDAFSAAFIYEWIAFGEVAGAAATSYPLQRRSDAPLLLR